MGGTRGPEPVLWLRTAFGGAARLGWRHPRDRGDQKTTAHAGGSVVMMAVPDPYLDADWLRVTPLADRVGLRLSGEADWHTVDILRQAIAELPPEADEIHLQLASLEFIDVAAARQLVALAERPAPSRVVLHGPPARLMWLISLLWPDCLDRFWVGAGQASQ
jgi:ABC-type transporter Mla MlaB component